tara:strand:- start:3310 stop:3492 length:183 start_codon:yes stop_codon:yes gene_type:complete
VEEEEGPPEQADQKERDNAAFDAVEPARNNVLQADAAAAEADGPVECYRQTSIYSLPHVS